jgi:hypothetical protein
MRSLGWIVPIVFGVACGAGDPDPVDGRGPTGGGKADDPSAPRGLDSFERDGEASPWGLASWAGAGDGQPRRGEAGATDGAGALQVPVRFEGPGYAQAYVGRAADLSVRHAAALAVDVTLPAGAPGGLHAKVVLLLGPDARWSEPPARVPLAPGATTRVALPLAAGLDPVPARELYDEVRGYGVKIDGTGVQFRGEIAIDHVRLEGLAPPAAADREAFSVGTFGGFARAGGPEIPARNGFAAFTADASVGRHRLLWPRLGEDGAEVVLGEARFAESPRPGAWRFVDWTTLESTAVLDPVAGAAVVRGTLSRALPAARYDTDGTTFGWSPGGRRLAVVLDGRPTVLDLHAGEASLARMSEPWILVLGTHPSGFDAPILVTLERRPTSARLAGGVVRLEFGRRAGVVNVMPLLGVRRLPAGETEGWAAGLPPDVLDHARRLVPVLAGFPVGCEESFEIDEAAGTVTVTDRYTHAEVEDDWGTVPVMAAPVPPVVSRAGDMGYPVRVDGEAVDLGVATFHGPFRFVHGGEARYTLPLPAGLHRLPIRLAVDGDPAAARALAAAVALVRDRTPAEPMDAFLDNDDRAAAFLAEALHLLPPAEAATARRFATRAIEHGFVDASMQELVEPVTGQRYLNNAKYWASTEPFDKEWYTGRQLAALALVAERFGLDVARGLWPRARALYRYDRIFFDWATGSALSSVMGFTALCDGIHFAWEGMLGTARLARLLGDEETFGDAAYRAARQQTALFAMWHHAAWVQELDYGVGHLSGVRLAPAEIETAVAIDGFVEDFGASTLELRSFWQTTNYLFFDNVPQFSFYRDHGLEPRLRTLEYELMPARHPEWTDAAVKDPVDGKHYGTEYAAAHLVARAALFHDAPGPLLAVYDATEGKPGSNEWYSMRRFGIAGPTLLAIASAPAPVVEAPVALARVTAARHDLATGATTLELAGRVDARGVVRSRAPGGAWRETAVTLRAGETARVVIAR